MVSLAFDWFRNADGDNGILKRNVAWCYHYLHPSGVFDAPLEKLQTNILKAESICKVLNVSYSLQTWAYLYDKLDAFPAAVEYFIGTCPGAIVIGYELSRAQLRAIDAAGKTFINLRTHPIRFLSDYVFGASTNSAAIHERLIALAPERSRIDVSVSHHKARAARRYQRRLNAAEGIVFFAQIASDASRIMDGEMLDDGYVITSLQEYVSKEAPKNIYYKQHPHEKIPERLLNGLKAIKAKETTTPTYDLLSVPGLRVCALSSSVCHEAEYFGAKATKFYDAPDVTASVGSVADVGSYIMLPANIYDPTVWKYLLGQGDLPARIYPTTATPFSTASGISWERR